MMNFYKSVAVAAIAVAFVSHPSMAQTVVQDPGHPRIAEVGQRLANEQSEVSAAVSAGQIRPRQATRDQEHLSKLSQELQADQAANGGAISAREQMKLNHQLDHMEGTIQRQIAGLPHGAPVGPAGTMPNTPDGMAPPPPPPGQ